MDPEELAAEQDVDPDIEPIVQWKRGGDDQPTLEDISPESRDGPMVHVVAAVSGARSTAPKVL